MTRATVFVSRLFPPRRASCAMGILGWRVIPLRGGENITDLTGINIAYAVLLPVPRSVLLP